MSDFPFDTQVVTQYIQDNYMDAWDSEDYDYNSNIIHDSIPSYIEGVSSDAIEVYLLRVKRLGYKITLIYEVVSDDFDAEFKVEIIESDFSVN